MIKLMTAGEALAELQRLENSGIQLLGLDGIKVLPDGRHMSPLDLILDFTRQGALPTSPAERFAQARQFVEDNQGPDMRWDIVSDSEE